MVSNVKLLFRPFETPEDAARVPFRVKKMRHPFFSWLGLRPVFAQHSAAEHEVLQRRATGRKKVVEIGVAEGASACALRESMSPEGTLYLIDPFHLTRLRALNALKRAAHAAVARSGKCRVEWIEDFSQKVVANWSGAIDLLFIDGDHKKEAVMKDWLDWSPFVAPDGIVLFHDARVFPGGWPTPEYGPVQTVNDLFRTGSQQGWRILEEVDSLVVVGRIQ
ncbi:MAG TPA: class I SAM-dependent methyltransferase [Candidatus Acidoferrum sp.]|nr:class I SAM-dependent methyltransferase [Candidatus Acidoferrum sp.]